jgi:hypothetical protein
MEDLIMHEENGHTHLNEEEASGGQKNTGMRYVLLISLFLAVVILSAVWLIPAMTSTSS